MTELQDAVEILDDLFGDTPGYREGVAEASENLQIAALIYEARQAAGLSQKQLADKIGSRQSVISRLEDADYTGHSLTMLRRVARALGLTLEIKLHPAAEKAEDLEEVSIANSWKPKQVAAFVTASDSKKRMYENAYVNASNKPGLPSSAPFRYKHAG